jgi:hypothetical protein
MTNCPHASREEFLAQVDSLIAELEEVHSEQVRSACVDEFQTGPDPATSTDCIAAQPFH